MGPMTASVSWINRSRSAGLDRSAAMATACPPSLMIACDGLFKAALELAGSRFDRPCGHRHRGTFGGEALRDRHSYPTAGAGDQGCAAGEEAAPHRSISFCCSWSLSETAIASILSISPQSSRSGLISMVSEGAPPPTGRLAH